MISCSPFSFFLLFFYGVVENLSGVPDFYKSPQAYDRSPQSPLPGKADYAQKKYAQGAGKAPRTYFERMTGNSSLIG